MHEVYLIDDTNNFNVWKNWVFKPSNSKTVCYGTETVSF